MNTMDYGPEWNHTKRWEQKNVSPLCTPIRIWGPFGCWAPPSGKVERRSYPFPTASGLCGLIRNILWKPEMRWIIDRVEVIREIKHVDIGTTNEIKKIPPFPEKRDASPLNVSENRTQRSNRILRSPGYIVYARPYTLGNQHPQKYKEMLQTRIERGAFFRSPFIGQRPYMAYVSAPRPDDQPIDKSIKLPNMFFGWNYGDETHPVFADVEMNEGIIRFRMKDWKNVDSRI